MKLILYEWDGDRGTYGGLTLKLVVNGHTFVKQLGEFPTPGSAAREKFLGKARAICC